jgi:hypothetical protein
LDTGSGSLLHLPPVSQSFAEGCFPGAAFNLTEFCTWITPLARFGDLASGLSHSSASESQEMR